jgi:antitoxin ParD1/3/4
MVTLNISLPDQMKEFVEEQVREGDYDTTSEYFSTLLQEQQRRKAEEKLEGLLLSGLASDSSTLRQTDWDDLHAELQRRVDASRSEAAL